MARTKNRFNAMSAEKTMAPDVIISEKKYKVALYARLSVERVSIPRNSIESQLDIMKAFLSKHSEFQEYYVYTDNGYSGTHFDRPEFKRMMDDVRNGKINCICVKDLSRFGRDYVETGKYMEQIFPFLGIRFIAINDNYDSAECAGGIAEIDVVFKGILYDFYSEDLSEKVKTSLAVRRANGKYIAAFAPYGYRKSEKDKYKLEVDEFASQIVKRIFREYLSGKSMYKIAEELNREGIDTPGVYIAMQEKNEKQLAKYRKKKPLWTNVAVGRILANEQYTGTMVYNRFKSENVGDKHAKVLPEEEWKRVENSHVAIISKEDFKKVAVMRKGNTCAGAERKHETHCLIGKMTCGNCGHRLFHTYAGRPKYYCAKHYLDKADGKCNISVLDETMEQNVMKSLQMFMDVMVDSRKIMDMQREKQSQRLVMAEKHLMDMENSYESINKDLCDAYENYKLGVTDKETYLEQKMTYEQLLEQMQENIEKQKVAVSKLVDMEVPEVAGFEMLERKMEVQKLSRDIVEAFVEEIVVYAKDRGEIKWKFGDEKIIDFFY